MKIFLLQLEIRSGLEGLVTGFLPLCSHFKTGGTNIVTRSYLHAWRMYDQSLQMPGKYYIFYDCPKIRIINHIKLVERRQKNFLWFVRALTDSFAVFVLILWNLFFLLFNTLRSLFPQQVSAFFQMAFQHTFQVPICFPMTDTWETDGTNGPLYICWIDEENCQEPDYIGLVPLAELAAQEEWQWLEIILIKMDLELVVLQVCYFYSSFFILTHPWIFALKTHE